MYLFLLSADMQVPDPDATASMLVDKLGIFGHPSWRMSNPGAPYVAHFLRVHKSLAISPTRVEPQGHRDEPNAQDPAFPIYLKSVRDHHAPFRPIVPHSTILVSDKVPEIIEMLMRRKVPFRVAPRTKDLPFDRLWVGVTPRNPVYEPSVDGGLCIEVVPSQPMGLPEEAFAVPAPQPENLAPGEMVRVEARGFLVDDLDDALRRLSNNLSFEPRGPVQFLEKEGYRVARMAFDFPNSASLDLIQPVRWRGSPAARYLMNWGPGPFYNRISVNGLEAKAGDLKSRGVEFTWIDESQAAGGRPMIQVAPESLSGLPFEFVEHVN